MGNCSYQKPQATEKSFSITLRARDISRINWALADRNWPYLSISVD